MCIVEWGEGKTLELSEKEPSNYVGIILYLIIFLDSCQQCVLQTLICNEREKLHSRHSSLKLLI